MGSYKYKRRVTRPDIRSTNPIYNSKCSKHFIDKGLDADKCLQRVEKTGMHLRNNLTGDDREHSQTLYSQPLSVHPVDHAIGNSYCSSDISAASGSPGIGFNGDGPTNNHQKSSEIEDGSTGKINEVVNSLMRIVKMQHSYLKNQSQNRYQREQSALVSRTVNEILHKVKQEPTSCSVPFKEQNTPSEDKPRKQFRSKNLKSPKLTNKTPHEDAVDESFDQPLPKKRRKGGPMACLNEPSIHDRLNLWILPSATRIAASEALDLCAIRTQMIEPRRRRAPVETYTPDILSIPKLKKIPSTINYPNQKTSKKIQSKPSSSSLMHTCCIPVASNLTVAPVISSNSSDLHSKRKSHVHNVSSSGKPLSLLNVDVSQTLHNDTASDSTCVMMSSVDKTCHYCDEPPLISTEKTYYLPDFLLEDERQEAMLFTLGEKNVEVPCWRVVDMSAAQLNKSKSSSKRSKKTKKIENDISDIEMLDDEVFLKRHSKGEQEEIRRDKRERQRLKELAQREKWEAKQRALQAKLKLLTLGVSEVNQPSLPNTLAADSDKGKVPVTVRDRIHVIAFGSAVPLIKVQQFSLPWLSSRNS